MEISEEVVSMSSPKELRLVGDQDIEEYAEALAVELKLRLKDSGRRGNISLPSPEEFVRRELDAGIVTNDSDEYAISDSALVDTIGLCCGRR